MSVLLQQFQTTKMDVDRVHQLLVDRKEDPYVCDRMSENVLGPAPKFDRENFWYVHLGCLLTTQQRSTAGSPVDRFLSLKPFPLSIGRCGNNVEEVVLQALKSFGIGKNRTIAQRASTNQSWLNKDGWPRVQRWFERLAEQRAVAPQFGHCKLEREAARYAAVNLEGFGPKQSRNLWQWLGLTRYETPLDSRVAKWINRNLSIHVDTALLGDDHYYDAVMNYLQDVCARAGVLPCLFDAAAFDNSNTCEAK
jgi:hypothetical protein